MNSKRHFTDAYGRNTEPKFDTRHKKLIFRSSYQKFFDGYSVKTIVNNAGKPIEVRMYTGTLFHQELSDNERKRIKISYILILLSALLLFVGGLALPIPVNSNVWCAMAAFPCFVMYSWLFFALVAYLPASQDFKLHEYNDGARVIAEKSIPASYTPAFLAIISFIFQRASGKGFSLLNLLYFAMLAGSGILIAIIGILERRINYTSIQDETESQNTSEVFFSENKIMR